MENGLSLDETRERIILQKSCFCLFSCPCYRSLSLQGFNKALSPSSPMTATVSSFCSQEIDTPALCCHHGKRKLCKTLRQLVFHLPPSTLFRNIFLKKRRKKREKHHKANSKSWKKINTKIPIPKKLEHCWKCKWRRTQFANKWPCLYCNNDKVPPFRSLTCFYVVLWTYYRFMRFANHCVLFLFTFFVPALFGIRVVYGFHFGSKQACEYPWNQIIAPSTGI